MRLLPPSGRSPLDCVDGCPDENDLVSYLDGALPEADRAEIESHCVACERCREVVVQAMRASRSTLEDSSAGAPPALQREVEAALRDVLYDYSSAEAVVGTRIGRFEIVGVQGRGGFGVVYRARDTELGRMVALKIMRQAARRDRSIPEALFRTEAAAAARLQHPNIVTLHDYGTFKGARYLILELLEGETLRDRLDRVSGLAALDALSIAIDVTHALVAAHAVGVIHRDIKPSNIFLCTGGQTKVLDLGLAQLHDPAEVVRQTQLGRATPTWAGTPPYMAPELFHGHEADECTDVFAMGVTLLEMLVGSTSWVTGPSIEGSVDQERMSPRLRQLIRRATASERAGRFQDASELLAALRRMRNDLTRARSSNRRLGMTVASVLAVATAAVAYRSFEPARRTSRSGIAVLGFEDLSGHGETAWLAAALSEMLHTDLVSSPAVRVASLEQVFHARTDLQLSERNRFDGATLRGLGRYLGVEYIVTGSYMSVASSDDSKIRIDVRLQDTAGQLLYAVSETDVSSHLLDVVARIASRLRVHLTGAEITTDEVRGLHVSMPKNMEAVRLYSEGLRRARSADPLGARDLLVRAVSADPDFPLAHSALSAVLHALREEVRMREEAQAAFELSKDLRQEERLLVEARYREAIGDWPHAFALRRELHDLVPDDLEHGLEFAEALDSHSRKDEARAVIAELRRLPPPWRDDPRIDLCEASATSSAVIRKALVTAAADKATALGARWVLARARVREAYVERELGELERSLAAAEESRTICESIGDREGLMIALFEIGTTQLLGGEPISATIVTYEQALTLARQIGDKVLVAQMLCNIASAYLAAGNPTQAALRLDEVEQLAADTALDAGTLEQAGRFRAIQWQETGDLERALAQLEHVRQVSVAPHKDRALRVDGEVLMAQGELDQARSRFEEFLAMDQSHDSTWHAMTVLALSRLEIEEGRTERAEAHIRECIATCMRTHDESDLATAQAALALVLVTERRFDEARITAEAALRLTARSEAMPDWIDARIALSWALFGSHPDDVDAALAEARMALDKARERGLVGQAYEARLAASAIAAQVHRVDASTQLRVLAAEADEHGFGLIASKARAAAARVR